MSLDPAGGHAQKTKYKSNVHVIFKPVVTERIFVLLELSKIMGEK